MGKANTNIIEINGKRYDATTGELLAAPKATKVIDGFVKPSQSAQVVSAITPAARPVQPATAAVSRPTVTDIRKPNHLAAPHKPQRGQTLMRTAVHKPAPGLKRQVKAITPTTILAKQPEVSVQPKLSISTVRPSRQARAEQVNRSEKVQKFAPSEQFPTAAQAFVIPAQPSESVASAVPIIPVATAPEATSKSSLDIFERALQQATAHEQQPYNPRQAAKAARKAERQQKAAARPVHRRLSTVVAASLAVIALTGLFAYTNRTAIKLHFASAAAGFQASVPAFKPAGYSLAALNYGAGQVNANFHNTVTGTTYSVLQKPSNWDSSTLLENFVQPKSSTYQTLQSAGRTIYVYGNNNATWVDRGVWYQITSNGTLSTSDVLRIASSL